MRKHKFEWFKEWKTNNWDFHIGDALRKLNKDWIIKKNYGKSRTEDQASEEN